VKAKTTFESIANIADSALISATVVQKYPLKYANLAFTCKFGSLSTIPKKNTSHLLPSVEIFVIFKSRDIQEFAPDIF